jgi:hypothetical protein
MLSEPQDRRALQRVFGHVLNGILDGAIKVAPEGNGLDDQVNDALNDLAAHMDQRAQKTLAAYEAFGGQLSGAHSTQAESEVLKLLGP